MTVSLDEPAQPDHDPWNPVPMAVIERLDFLGVPTQDPERSRSFYRDVLGLRPDEHAEWEQWAGDKRGCPPCATSGRCAPSPLRSPLAWTLAVAT